MRIIAIAGCIIAVGALAGCTQQDPSFAFKGPHFECWIAGGKTEITLEGVKEVITAIADAATSSPPKDPNDIENAAEALQKEFELCKQLFSSAH